MDPHQINPPDGQETLLSRSPSPKALASTNIAGVPTRVLAAPVVPAPVASIAQAATLNSLTMTQGTEALVASGLLSALGLPPTVSEPKPQVVDLENESHILAVALEAYTKNLMSILSDSNLPFLPVTSLSNPGLGQSASMTHQNTVALPLLGSAVNLPTDELAYTLITGPVQVVPVLMLTISNDSFTLVDHADTNVVIDSLSLPKANTQTFINAGPGTLTVLTDGINIEALTLIGNVNFTATDNQVITGVNVIAHSDSSNITLFLHGADSNLNSTDRIDLGNGNNFVLDTGTGTVLVNLGSGSNTVMLAGTGVSGSINFAAHLDSAADFVTIAPNGLANPVGLATQHLVTISGLNNHAQSSDALAFLGDMNHQLVWANGSANAARITNVAGDTSQLSNWVSAAQNQASDPHSVAWFQFGGDTYVLESAYGNSGNHVGDTLVKLAGTSEFTGAYGELTIGMLHFVA